LSLTNTPAQTVKIFSTPEFHAAVLGLNPVVAVFDCDGTLWSGDAGTGFMHWTIDQGILSPDTVARIDQRYRGYLAGQVSELEICGEMVQIYAGLRESDMRAAAREFFRTQVERNIFPEMEVLLRELQFRGVEIWAVSSTCNWVVEEAVRRFHIQPSRVLAAQVEIDSDTGLVTDRLIAVPPTKPRSPPSPASASPTPTSSSATPSTTPPCSLSREPTAPSRSTPPATCCSAPPQKAGPSSTRPPCGRLNLEPCHPERSAAESKDLRLYFARHSGSKPGSPASFARWGGKSQNLRTCISTSN